MISTKNRSRRRCGIKIAPHESRAVKGLGQRLHGTELKMIYRRKDTGMRIYVTKQSHYKFNYLMNWHNPETGNLMGTWFCTLKDLLEYTENWPNREIIRLNF